MAATDTLASAYEALQPAERVTLRLEALARGDAADAEHLARTCPVQSYRMADAAYTDRLQLLQTFAIATCADLRCIWGKVVAVEVLWDCLQPLLDYQVEGSDHAFFEGYHFAQEAVEAFQDAPANAEPGSEDREAVPSDPADAELQRRLDELEADARRHNERLGRVVTAIVKDQLREFVSLWAASDQFCRRHAGVDGMTLLLALGIPYAPDFAALPQRDPKPATDPALVDYFTDLLEQAWTVNAPDGDVAAPVTSARSAAARA